MKPTTRLAKPGSARMAVRFLARLVAGFLLASCAGRCGAAPALIRIGHFPNITHAQALVAHHLTRTGKGWFESRLGPELRIDWFVFNAGPSAMEAMFAQSIDLTFVGPNPAINGYVRSKGQELRIVAGACSGGAALVVQPDGRIQKDGDFRGKKIATPQFGNTQDVAARAFFVSKGFRISMTGGDLTVIPTANPDQLALFQKGDLDGVWTVEPWVSRLLLEGHAKVYLEESTLWPKTGGRYPTTLVVSSVKFLRDKSDLLHRWLAAYVELNQWIREHPDEAKTMVNEEIQKETTRAMPGPVLEAAWNRLELTYDPIRQALLDSAEGAYHVGMVREKPELGGIHDLNLLNGVLREKGVKELP